MQIGINDLDDDDFGMGFEPSQPTQPDSSLQLEEEDEILNLVNNQNEDDFLSDFLKSRGIDDPSKIKFEDDNGNIEEKDWNTLSKEEKFNILNTPLEVQNSNQDSLTQDEVNFLNEVRKNNLTPQEYLQLIIYNNQNTIVEPLYKIDDLSDDELFILDLESRVGELSDDEAAQALTNAKQTEDLFKKLIEGIRKEYREREDYLLQQEQAKTEQELQEAYLEFQDNVINSINDFNSVGNLDLNFTDDDREELAQFMLSKDEAGNNYLMLALQDPETLVRAAWFILNGDEAFNNISEYFINLIKLVSRNLYNKGFEEGKTGNSSKPQIVINNKLNHSHQQKYNSINDLDDDE